MHKSVLLNEALEYLECEKSKIVLDCTLGGGGHAKEILKRLPIEARFIGIDADKEAIEIARDNLKDLSACDVKLVQSNFRDLDKVLEGFDIDGVDAMLFDLGISSFQVEDPERGFSFKQNGPLDMRMDISCGIPLCQELSRLSEAEIGTIIRDFGEERYWRRIARSIVQENKRLRIEDTHRLASIIRRSQPYKGRARIDPATRSFQAFRIFLNDEVNALIEALEKAVRYLNKGARIVVISFHSIEDRIVKHAFKRLKAEGILDILTKKPVGPSAEEKDNNPRARSAKLRAAEKIIDLRIL